MESLQPGVYACVVTTFTVSFVTLVLRFYARKIKNVMFWWDDWLAVLSFVRFAHGRLCQPRFLLLGLLASPPNSPGRGKESGCGGRKL